MFHIPPALVLGCNNPVSLNPLKDFIEEVTGFEPDFQQSGYSDGDGVRNSDGIGYAHEYGSSTGCGRGHGRNYGLVTSHGFGITHSNGRGNGYNYGYSWNEDDSGNGCGDGCGYFGGYGKNDGNGQSYR